MLGVYHLQQRIVTAFPHVLLENCASGGGRFDPGTTPFAAAVFLFITCSMFYGSAFAYLSSLSC